MTALIARSAEIRIVLGELDTGTKVDLVEHLGEPLVRDLLALRRDMRRQFTQLADAQLPGQEGMANAVQLVEEPPPALLRLLPRRRVDFLNSEQGIDGRDRLHLMERLFRLRAFQRLREAASGRLA